MSGRAPTAVIELLGKVPLFASCNQRELQRIARLGTEVTVPPGTELTVQGRAGSEFMLVLNGTARCLIDDREVARYGPGDSFGELALLDGGTRSATIVAETPIEVLVLNRGEFFQMLDSAPSISRKLLITLAGYQRTNAPDPVHQ